MLRTGLAPVFFGVVLWALFFSPYVSIQGVVVAGTERVSREGVEEKAAELLKRPLFLFVRQNTLFFVQKTLRRELVAAFPKIADIEFSRDIQKGTIHLQILERESQGIWCAVSYEEVRKEGEEEEEGQEPPEIQERILECFFVDKEGVVFAYAPKTRGGLILVLKEATENIPALGEMRVDPAFLVSLMEIKEELAVGIEEFQLRSSEDFRMKTVEGWEVLLAPDRPLEGQVLVLREVLRKEISVEKRKTLEYIDLRVPNRAYYK